MFFDVALPSFSWSLPAAFCALPLSCWLVLPRAAPTTSLALPFACFARPAANRHTGTGWGPRPRNLEHRVW